MVYYEQIFSEYYDAQPSADIHVEPMFKFVNDKLNGRMSKYFDNILFLHKSGGMPWIDVDINSGVYTGSYLTTINDTTNLELFAGWDLVKQKHLFKLFLHVCLSLNLQYNAI